MNKKIWTAESVKKEALKYKTKSEFKAENGSAYNAAKRLKVFDAACKHMPDRDHRGNKNPNYKYSHEDLLSIAICYNSKNEFAKNNPSAYKSARHRGLHLYCAHMRQTDLSGENNPNFRHTLDKIANIALKYKTRKDFQKNEKGIYKAALRRGILDQVCAHMKKIKGSSEIELELFKKIKNYYPDAIKKRDTSVKITGKPYIKSLEIDIFIPSLNKGIEFDGEYWHSFKHMRKSERKKLWTDEDILNYHSIKDKWFLSKGIEVLHIKEEDWNKNSDLCVQKCLEFLRG